ncbi:hypothetical protein D3C85_1608960 [compost metagenome]
MGTAMHHRSDALSEDTGFGVVVNTFDFDVFEIRPVRNAETPRMAEFEKFDGVCAAWSGFRVGTHLVSPFMLFLVCTALRL